MRKKQIRFAQLFLILLAAASLARVVYFAYIQKIFDSDSSCTDIPDRSTVFVLGFEYAEDVSGNIIPGPANTFLAVTLANCADRFAQVVTQKAISDALESEGLLQEGKLLGKVEVLQMHEHSRDKPVRTFQALEAALQKLNPIPTNLVLLAHDKQIERAVSDLNTLYQGKNYVWKVNEVPYQNERWYTPLRWAVREIFAARPVDFYYRFNYRFGKSAENK
jgi:hypothetical protein